MFTTSIVSVVAIVLLYTSVHCASADPGSHDCLPVEDKPQCVCKIQNNGSVIDLTSIPTLSGIDAGSGFKYWFNPCEPVTDCGDDKTSAVCQSSVGFDHPYSCGHTDTVAIDIDNDRHFVMQFTGGEDNRMSHVTLRCDPNATHPVFTVKGEQSEGFYNFELKSKCACANLCSDQLAPNNKGVVIHVGGIGIGIISLVIVVAMSYVIVGVVVSIANGKRGTEVIPQKDFWFGVCGLVKDGCVFTFSPICSRTKRMTTGYDKL